MNEEAPQIDQTAVGIRMEVGPHSRAVFLAAVQERALSRMRSWQRPVGPVAASELAEVLGEAAFLSRTDGGEFRAIFDQGDVLVYVDVHHRLANISAAANDEGTVEAAAEEFFALFPAPEPPEVKTPFNFWSEADGHGFLIHRTLEAQPWEDIADGYPVAVRPALGDLMTLKTAPSGGRLVLWHGEPGTGKTHALRALAHAWREWCSVHFITDPDRFIGERMSYPISVLTSNEELRGQSHRLLVLEDAGELLAPDARRQSGPGLSRLLNLTDGLLGMGMNTITLVTTNEPIGRLHPAVHRPGRCLSEVEFTALDVDEATAWLERRSSDEIVTEPKTLAQLYAIHAGRDQRTRRAAVGFG